MNVAKLMTKNVACAQVDETLADAAERMWNRDCGVLPVLDGNARVVGMITDRDICMSTWMRGSAPQNLQVATAMSHSLHHCSQEDSLDYVSELMRSNQIRRLPVLDGQGQLVGIISLADIAREADRERPRGQKEVQAGDVAVTLANVCRPPEARPDGTTGNRNSRTNQGGLSASRT
jgi:CBS domain-containing protein